MLRHFQKIRDYPMILSQSYPGVTMRKCAAVDTRFHIARADARFRAGGALSRGRFADIRVMYALKSGCDGLFKIKRRVQKRMRSNVRFG